MLSSVDLKKKLSKSDFKESYDALENELVSLQRQVLDRPTLPTGGRERFDEPSSAVAVGEALETRWRVVSATHVSATQRRSGGRFFDGPWSAKE